MFLGITFVLQRNLFKGFHVCSLVTRPLGLVTRLPLFNFQGPTASPLSLRSRAALSGQLHHYSTPSQLCQAFFQCFFRKIFNSSKSVVKPRFFACFAPHFRRFWRRFRKKVSIFFPKKSPRRRASRGSGRALTRPLPHRLPRFKAAQPWNLFRCVPPQGTFLAGLALPAQLCYA